MSSVSKGPSGCPVDLGNGPGYLGAVNTTETVFEAIKDLVGVSNPGLVTKEDLSRLECRLEELTELFAEIEAQVIPPTREPEAG